jgi:hypothetical protein
MSLRWMSWLDALILFFFFFLIWLRLDPFHTALTMDPAIYAYMAQQAAAGNPPHLTVYEVKSSLSVLLGALAIHAGARLNLPEIFSLRLYMLVVTALGMVAMLWLGTAFSRLQIVGWLSALFLASFTAFVGLTVNGVEPKAVMLLFSLVALLALTRRAWFWAGVAAACAGLAWQIGMGYVALALLLAFAQNDHARARLDAAGRVLLGALLPAAAYSLYFVTHGAAQAAFEQNVLVPFFSKSSQLRLGDLMFSRMVKIFVTDYRNQIPIGVLAIVGWLGWWWYTLRSRERFVFYFIKNPRTSGTLLALHGLFLYSLLDFQSYPDWIPLLPFVALLASGALVVLFLRLARRVPLLSAQRSLALGALGVVLLLWVNQELVAAPQTKLTLQDQMRVAAELNERLGAANPVWILGKNELLFFMRRQNPNRYTFLLTNTDAVIERIEPGGFAGMLARTRAAAPALIVTSRLRRKHLADPRNYDRLAEWIAAEYVPLRVCAGGGNFFARADLASTLFAFHADHSLDNCIRLARQ